MPVFKDGHSLSLLQGSEVFFSALKSAMEAARHEVRMETYLFDFTASGSEVARHLESAAQRGVKVYLLVDGAGTEHIPQEWQQRFDAAGVQWLVYNPLGRLGLLLPSRWRRLHRKLCVMDGGTPDAVGFCGGINVLDDFHDPNHGTLTKPRFDFSVRVQGALVDDIHDATSSLWLRQTAYKQLRQRRLQAAASTWVKSRELPSRFVIGSKPVQAATEAPSGHLARAALLLRDNLRYRKRIERAYLKAISEAQQDIVIANAYFLPGRKLRQALLKAAKRGVKIKLLLQGRYEYFMQYHAARPVYNTLLAAGIEIYEYESSFLHAKVAVIDAYSAKAWATVGSSNLDPLSLLLAREANIVVLDGAFARDLRERLIAGMLQDGNQLSAQEMASRPWHQRLLDRVAFGLMRLALSVTGRRY
ncbi:MAG: cardiolipin synthase ClsB [Burkholderiales bacterium]|nr:MAG: cardiolipin synthase ClsB [Burkholderiales bacterium]